MHNEKSLYELWNKLSLRSEQDMQLIREYLEDQTTTLLNRLLEHKQYTYDVWFVPLSAIQEVLNSIKAGRSK